MKKRVIYKRVVLKITGEAIQGNNKIFDRKALDFLADEIKSVYKKVELAIVIGGGNIVRGKNLIKDLRTTSSTADQIGMTATIINALLLQDFLEREGLETRVLSSIDINALAEPYIIRSNPGVTTDTAAILRASDIQADIIMKGTKVDGIYDSDPIKNKNAKFLKKISYHEFLEKGLSGILDRTAIAQAEMKKMPIFVFNIFKAGNLLKAVQGQVLGSRIN